MILRQRIKEKHLEEHCPRQLHGGGMDWGEGVSRKPWGNRGGNFGVSVGIEVSRIARRM